MKKDNHITTYCFYVGMEQKLCKIKKEHVLKIKICSFCCCVLQNIIDNLWDFDKHRLIIFHSGNEYQWTYQWSQTWR